MAFLELQCQQMLRAVVESILEDDSFKLSSPHAKAALETANQLVTYLKDDEHQQEFFFLFFCFFSSIVTAPQVERKR